MVYLDDFPTHTSQRGHEFSRSIIYLAPTPREKKFFDPPI